jgi:hypothetical protein
MGGRGDHRVLIIAYKLFIAWGKGGRKGITGNEGCCCCFVDITKLTIAWVDSLADLGAFADDAGLTLPCCCASLGVPAVGFG